MKNTWFLPEILFLLLFSLPPLFWLHDNYMILGHDSGGQIDFITYYLQLFSTWSNQLNFGISNGLQLGFLILQLPELLFSLLAHSVTAAQQLSSVFWFAAMGLSMYFSIKSFFPDKKHRWLRLSAALLYQYNFFILQGWFITERAKFAQFVAVPAIFAILHHCLSGKSSVFQSTVLLAIILFFFNAGGSLPFYGAILVIGGIVFLVQTLDDLYVKNFSRIFRNLATVILMAVLTLLYNAYWLIPSVITGKQSFGQVVSGSGGVESYLAWQKMVTQYASFVNLFRLQGIPDWYSTQHQYSKIFLENPVFILLSFLPIICIALSFRYIPKYLKKQEFSFTYIISLFFIFIVGLFLTAGSRSLLGSGYEWLFTHVPGFIIFRSTFYKFGVLYWFAFISLFSIALHIFLEKIEDFQWRTILGSAIIVLILGYHWPYFTVNFFQFNSPFSTRVRPPEYVFEMKDFIRSHLNTGSFFLLPQIKDKFKADGYTWGYWSLDILVNQLSNQPVFTNNSDDEFIQEVYQSIRDKNKAQFLEYMSFLNVRYIFWRGDILDSKGKSLEAMDQENKNFIESLASEQVHFGEWSVFSLPELKTKETVYFTVPLECKSCLQGKEQSKKQNYAVHIVKPYISITPSSNFYPLVLMKEKIIRLSLQPSFDKLFQYELLISHKRFLEITLFAEFASSNSRENELFENFHLSLERVQEMIDRSPNTEKRKKSQNIDALLDSMLSDLENKKDEIPLEVYKKLEKEILKHKTVLVFEENILKKPKQEQKTESINIPFSAYYQLPHGNELLLLSENQGEKEYLLSREEEIFVEKGSYEIDFQQTKSIPFVLIAHLQPDNTWETVEPTKESFRWEGQILAETKILYLPQKYNSGWKIIPKTDDIFKKIFYTMFSAENMEHKNLGTSGQYWVIEDNSNFSGPVEVVFETQYWFYLGGSISVISFLITGVIYILRKIKRGS